MSKGKYNQEVLKEKNLFLSRAVNILDKWYSDYTIVVYQRSRQQIGFFYHRWWWRKAGDHLLCSPAPRHDLNPSMFQYNVIFRNI